MITINILFLISMVAGTNCDLPYPMDTTANIVYGVLSDAQIQSFINTHNYFRLTVSGKLLSAMKWWDKLAVSSDNWASKCIWKDSETPNVGENLYATTVRNNSINFDPTTAVNSWGSENVYYDHNRYGRNKCETGKVCDHYAQIIWDHTSYVGCGFRDCPIIQGLSWPNGGTIVVCHYYLKDGWY